MLQAAAEVLSCLDAAGKPACLIGALVALAAFPFELEAIERSSLWQAAPDIRLRTCPAELVVYKLVPARPHDLVDVEGIRRQGRRLDVEGIRRWGRELAELKEAPKLRRSFEDVLRKIP